MHTIVETKIPLTEQHHQTDYQDNNKRTYLVNFQQGVLPF
jgi:hypothetical protein